MESTSPKFGDVLHKNVSHDSIPFKIPSGFDPAALDHTKSNYFLSDDVKAILDIPLSHKPHMALVDDVVFTTYLQKMDETAQRLDELIMRYEDIDNSLPGQGKDHLRSTVQSSLLLASKLKTSPLHHLTLAGLSRWLKQQRVDIEKTQEGLDNFAAEVRQMEEEAAVAKEAVALAEEQQKPDLAHEVEYGGGNSGDAEQQGAGSELRFTHDGGEIQRDGIPSYKMSARETQAKKMSVHSAAIAASVVIQGRTSVFAAPAPTREISDGQLGAGTKGKNDSDVFATELKELKQLRGTVQSQTQQLTQKSAQLKSAERDIDHANATIEDLKQQLMQLNPSLNLNSPEKSRKGGPKKSRAGGLAPASPAMTQISGAAAALQGNMETTAGPNGGMNLSVAIPPSPAYQETPTGGKASATGFASRLSPITASMTSPAPHSMMSPPQSMMSSPQEDSSSSVAMSAHATTPAALATPATDASPATDVPPATDARSPAQQSRAPKSRADTSTAVEIGQGSTAAPSPRGQPARKPRAPAPVAKGKNKPVKSKIGEQKPSMAVNSNGTQANANGGDEDGGDDQQSGHASWVEVDSGPEEGHTDMDDPGFPYQGTNEGVGSTQIGDSIEDPAPQGSNTEDFHVSDLQDIRDDGTDNKLRAELKRLRAERRAQASQIFKLEQEVREMSQALGQTIATVEGAAGRSPRGRERPSVKSPRSRAGSLHGVQRHDRDSCAEDDEDCENKSSHRLHQKCGHPKPKRGRSAHQQEADLTRYTEDPREEDLPEGWESCPRCTELEKQLQYWRKKSWYQKARNARWDKLKARRDEIVVNVDSKFAGLIMDKEATAPASSQLGLGADQLQGGGLGGRRAATSTTDCSHTQTARERVRTSRSTPGMMNSSKRVEGFSAFPSEIQYVAPNGQAVVVSDSGGFDDTDTLHNLLHFNPASAALKRSQKGNASPVRRHGNLQAHEVSNGEHGADHSEPFALRESLAKLLHCGAKGGPGGLSAQLGEPTHREKSRGHGEGGRIMFGGEFQLGSRSVPPTVKGRRAHRSAHHSQTGDLEDEGLGLFSHLAGGSIVPASLPGTAATGRARGDVSHHSCGADGGNSQASQTQSIEKQRPDDKTATEVHESSTQQQHTLGSAQIDKSVESSRCAAAKLKVDILRRRTVSREPATAPSLHTHAHGKQKSSRKAQDLNNSVDHATIMLEEKGSQMRKIAAAAPPKTLQTAPKKGALRSAIALQQTRNGTDVDGQKRGSFSVKGQRPPRLD